MKRCVFLLSALVLLASCGQTDKGFYNKPTIVGEDPYFSQIEYAPASEKSITISALNGVDMITVSLPSGNPDFALAGAKQVIGIAANRTGSTLVLDLIDDTSVAQAFVSGKIVSKAGASVRGSKDPVVLNITRLVTLLAQGQDVASIDAVIRFQIDVVDQSEYRTTQTVSVRFTPGPSFVWNNKTPEKPVALSQADNFKAVKVLAPGKISSILLKVTSPSAEFNKWLKDRSATNSAGFIDVLSQESSMLKLVSSTVTGSTSCTLDFGEVLSNLKLYAAKDGGSAQYQFQLVAKDELGRESSLTMLFKNE